MAVNEQEDRPAIPRSIRHKQILDKAEEQPDASMEAIAAEVPSVTTEIVESVLEEYDDPAAADHDTLPTPDDLSSTQRETLQAIHEHPTASQRELADVLDVSGATVSNRANSIEGFVWDDRQAFADAVFDNGRQTTAEETPDMATDQTESNTTINELTDRVTALERQVTDIADDDTSRTVFGDPELTHKIVHACLKSDTVTEDEELRILKVLLQQ